MAGKIATRNAYGQALCDLAEKYPEPVSYTHLDVYKRQVPQCPGVYPGTEPAYDGGCAGGEIGAGQAEAGEGRAVGTAADRLAQGRDAVEMCIRDRRDPAAGPTPAALQRGSAICPRRLRRRRPG